MTDMNVRHIIYFTVGNWMPVTTHEATEVRSKNKIWGKIQLNEKYHSWESLNLYNFYRFVQLREDADVQLFPANTQCHET